MYYKCKANIRPGRVLVDSNAGNILILDVDQTTITAKAQSCL